MQKRGRFDEAKRIFEDLAAKEYAPGYTNLAALYSNGQGVVKNKELAIELLKKGVAGGDYVAFASLGKAYVYGEGIEKSCSSGISLLKESSESGYEWASYTLGNIYSEGLCGESNGALAISYYNKNISQGSYEGYTGIGRMYHYGYGVDVDEEKAKYFYLEAYSKKSKFSANALGLLCLSSGDNINICIDYFEDAYKFGSAIAPYNLALIYYNEKYTTRNCNKSLQWAMKSAKKGNVNSMRLLGKIFESGCLGDYYPQKANEWFRKASELGDEYSIKRLSLDK